MTRKEWKIRMAARPATFELRSCDVALAVARRMRRNDERALHHSAMQRLAEWWTWKSKGTE